MMLAFVTNITNLSKLKKKLDEAKVSSSPLRKTLRPKIKIPKKDDINKLKISQKQTNIKTGKESFITRALSGVIDKMDDPLGKKRGSLEK